MLLRIIEQLLHRAERISAKLRLRLQRGERDMILTIREQRLHRNGGLEREYERR